MNEDKLKRLIALFTDSDLEELEIQSFWTRVKLARNRTSRQVPVSTLPPASASPATASVAPPIPDPVGAESTANEELHVVTSPMVGTLYLASSPEDPPFVKIGDQVTPGQTLCLIEAMKIMNEIEADVKGEVVEILVSDGNPVEYSQPLVQIRPT